MEETTSFKLERNVATLWMHLSSRESAETQLAMILPLWLRSEMDAVDGGNYQFQIRENCRTLWIQL